MALTREQKIQIEHQLRHSGGLAPHAEVALLSLGENEYGHCLDCGADIPFERLRAQPTVLQCARCQALFARDFSHP